MAYNSTTAIGNGTGAYQTDIVVKDLDLDVSNRVKDDTPVLNMCMAKKRKVVSTLPLWTNDTPSLRNNAFSDWAPISFSASQKTDSPTSG